MGLHQFITSSQQCPQSMPELLFKKREKRKKMRKITKRKRGDGDRKGSKERSEMYPQNQEMLGMEENNPIKQNWPVAISLFAAAVQ